MEPLYVYIAGVGLIAFPSVAFNKLAGVIVGVWAIAYLAAFSGAPLPESNLVQHSAGCVLGLWAARTLACKIVVALYVPMIATDLALLAGYTTPFQAWWLIFTLAMMQLTILPFGNDWFMIREGLRAVLDMSWIDRLLKVFA